LLGSSDAVEVALRRGARFEISGLGHRAGFGPVLRNASTGLPVLFAAVAKLVEFDLLRLGLPLARPGL